MLNTVTMKDYLKVTIPFMLSTATQPLLGAANTAMMGRMPTADYIAAVSLSVIFFNNVYWLFGFLRVATTAFSSQAVGTGKQEDVFLSMARPFVLAAIISCLFILFYPWIFNWYTEFMNPELNVVYLMSQYSDIAIIGAPFVLLNYVVLGWLMGQMLVKKVMTMQITMNLLNIALSFITVFYLGMGIDGVAWSMVIAQIYGLIVGIVQVWQSNRFKWKAEFVEKARDFTAFISLLKVQCDLMIRTTCLLVINNLFTEAGTSLGTEVLAANAVLLQLVLIISFFIDGMANGVSVFGGKAWGARNIEMFDSTVKVGMKCLWIFSIAAAIISLLGGEYVLTFMTNQANILEKSSEHIIYVVVHPLTAGVGLLLYGFYTATGYTSYIRNMMIVAALIFALGQMILLPMFGNHGLWITYIITYLFESIMYFGGMKYLRKRMFLQMS